ncbi:uncharacterized protein LOC125005379 [Tachysurus ichikawai]
MLIIKRTTNKLTQTLAGQVNFTNFVPAGQHQVYRTTPKDASILPSARDWKLEVDLEKKLVFPPEIVATTLQPDMGLWSPVPCEDGVEEACERKKNKYSDLAAEASQNSWKTSIFPVEVGGMQGMKNRGEGSLALALQQAIKSMSSAAEKSIN